MVPSGGSADSTRFLPALFAAGIVPGVLSGLTLIAVAIWLSKRHGFGVRDVAEPVPPFWASFREAIWGLAAPIIILGGMRSGWFTPTEAAVVAAFYGFAVGTLVYRSLGWRDIYEVLADAAEIAAVILLVAIIAAIALTLRRRKDTKAQEPARQVAVRRAERVRLVSMPAEKER